MFSEYTLATAWKDRLPFYFSDSFLNFLEKQAHWGMIATTPTLVARCSPTRVRLDIQIPEESFGGDVFRDEPWGTVTFGKVNMASIETSSERWPEIGPALFWART